MSVTVIYSHSYDRNGISFGNHLGNYDALDKVCRREESPDGPNPFVDPSEWKRFLTGRAELVRQLMIEDPVE